MMVIHLMVNLWKRMLLSGITMIRILFYWISHDTARMGIPTLTRYDDLTINTVTPEVNSLNNNMSIGNTTVIKTLGVSCDVNQATAIVPETNPKSFSEDDWGTIARAIKLGKTDNYHVGDTKTVDMGSSGKHKIRISNLSNSECVGVASQTTCVFVAEFVDVIATHPINPAGMLNGNYYRNGWNIGSWPSSSMYKKINTDIYNALPRELQEVIIDTKVVSAHGKMDSDNFVSYDKLYLLSVNEVYGASFVSTVTTVRGIDNQLDWYCDIGKVNSTNFTGAQKKNSTGNNTTWYLRTVNRANDYTCYYVLGSSGQWYNAPCSINRGLSPASRIG